MGFNSGFKGLILSSLQPFRLPNSLFHHVLRQNRTYISPLKDMLQASLFSISFGFFTMKVLGVSFVASHRAAATSYVPADAEYFCSLKLRWCPGHDKRKGRIQKSEKVLHAYISWIHGREFKILPTAMMTKLMIMTITNFISGELTSPTIFSQRQEYFN